jgi:hypothetical protein
LVNVLYAELAKKNPALNELEEKIKRIEESKTDSLKYFDLYNVKNNAFYTSAKAMLEQVRDSTIKAKLKVMVDKSLNSYNELTSDHTALLKQLDFKNSSLNDLHILLKISTTLPLIEKYQKQSKPTTKSITGLIKEMDKAIKKADTLSKK